ncbi:MAG: hypothetical protein H7124_09895 [Phycisphaerales bacterium]|nr:hypothetical protein [Hyphomonadaceae bacterium]
MKLAGLAVIVLALAACSPQQDAKTAEIPAATSAAQQAACSAETSRDWSAVGSQYYVIEAEARGDTCAGAVATIRIRAREGAVLFTRDYPIAQVPLAFNPNSDQTGLRTDLDAWTQNTAEPPTADTLPAWPSGASRPPGFDPAVGRNAYEAARGAQGPVFCYPDGGESNACVALAGDAATFLGSLTPERM